ncbi:MAG: hypothetical protein AAFX06_04180 [Planctomycetota bacterium]
MSSSSRRRWGTVSALMSILLGVASLFWGVSAFTYGYLFARGIVLNEAAPERGTIALSGVACLFAALIGFASAIYWWRGRFLFAILSTALACLFVFGLPMIMASESH